GGPCATGSWDNDMSAASACAPWSNCSAGSYISPTASGSTTADRQCLPCAAGTFSAAGNAAMCSAWTSCGTTSFVSVAGTSKTDNTCTPYTVCMPGEFVQTAGTA